MSAKGGMYGKQSKGNMGKSKGKGMIKSPASSTLAKK
jgi:hypothetical protein